MPALDIPAEAGLLASFFGGVVLLPLLDEPVRAVMLARSSIAIPVLLGCGAVTRVKLFQDLVSRLRAVLTLGVVLRSLLVSVAVLHL